MLLNSRYIYSLTTKEKLWKKKDVEGAFFWFVIGNSHRDLGYSCSWLLLTQVMKENCTAF